MAFESRFALESKVLRAKVFNDGWLGLDNPNFRDKEQAYLEGLRNGLELWKACEKETREIYHSMLEGYGICQDETHKGYRCQGARHFTVSCELTSFRDYISPYNNTSPQYLHFLECINLLVSDIPIRCWPSTHVQGRELYFQFDFTSFYEFLHAVNYVLVDVKDGKVVRKDKGFPRELLLVLWCR
jgi:hypothetical protein